MQMPTLTRQPARTASRTSQALVSPALRRTVLTSPRAMRLSISSAAIRRLAALLSSPKGLRWSLVSRLASAIRVCRLRVAVSMPNWKAATATCIRRCESVSLQTSSPPTTGMRGWSGIRAPALLRQSLVLLHPRRLRFLLLQRLRQARRPPRPPRLLFLQTRLSPVLVPRAPPTIQDRGGTLSNATLTEVAQRLLPSSLSPMWTHALRAAPLTPRASTRYGSL